ncbi:hypothetical protein GK047_14540 [Paenibacillus sp. SYP-B3998]|uniref:Uncharacterized protein n=1 Tax=Paenibacillus sp. SYP-B3998 TaxID=2678564 RepID=A0A6G3ZZV9_9BACL|nr:hypothetical protein [Paenibacillus sp. SYP-B3998]NEW07224.1 hypothetical protein [Paenibacillus sp. SYP-B3998]
MSEIASLRTFLSALLPLSEDQQNRFCRLFSPISIAKNEAQKKSLSAACITCFS